MGSSAHIVEAPVLSLEMSPKSSINLTKKTCSNHDCEKYFEVLSGKFCQECSAPLENKYLPTEINLDESLYDTAMIILGEIQNHQLSAFSWSHQVGKVFIHFYDYEIECTSTISNGSYNVFENCILSPAPIKTVEEKVSEFKDKYSKVIEKLAEIVPRAKISIENKIFLIRN